MLAIVTPDNRALYARELDEMFRLRYRVEVECWRWRLPDARDGRDRDQFDRDETIYFLSLSDEGAVVGCGRLNPTLSPHLLSDVFAKCCALGGVRRGPDIWEFSRYVIDPALKRKDYFRAMGEIEFAINHFCLEAGIAHLTWLSYLKVYQHALTVWDTRPLGLPQHFDDDGGDYIAAISAMTAEGLERVRAKYGFGQEGPVATLRYPWSHLGRLFDVPAESQEAA